MSNEQLTTLLEEKTFLEIPQEGDLISADIIDISGKEIRVNISNLTTGVIRGRELFAESSMYKDVKVGDAVEATVIDLENENGEMELSFRYAGQKKAWEQLRELMKSGEAAEVKIKDANKGGLIVNLEHIGGFLPVSQLAPENYPRVSGGEKAKILEKLKEFVGATMKVRVIDVNEDDEKLIVSEKALWEDKQKNVIAQYNVGDAVEGQVTAIADFGVFVKFDSLEGLVHISELAWQRIDHPKDVVKVGETVKAEVIGIEGSKIFLSMKKLMDDPWKDVAEKYKLHDIVEGTILKVNPFGFFVELDKDIHGLAHISELSDGPVEDIHSIGRPGERMKFRIVSIEPNEHRLGLSLKALKEKPGAEETGEDQKAQTAQKDQEVQEDANTEDVENVDSAEATETPEEAPATEAETKEETKTEEQES